MIFLIRENYFNKSYTNILKGIAILMMLSHHLYFGQLSSPIHWFGGDSFAQIFATIFKVCVSIFAFLSGYGLTEQYKRKDSKITDLDFVCDKTIKMMKQYWFVFFIFVPLGFLLGENPIQVYGTGMLGIFHFIVDAFGLAPLAGNPTMNFSWWYIEAALFFYLFFPYFYKMVKKIPYIIFPITYILFAKYAAIQCREIFWFFPFCVGILYSEKRILNRYIKKIKRSNEDRLINIKLKAIVSLIFWLFVRSKLGIMVDVFFTISIIKFVICFIKPNKVARNIFKVLGVHSCNIYLIHSFIYYYYEKIATPFNLIPSKIVQYIVLLLVSFILSVLLEVLKLKVNNIFQKQKELLTYSYH